MGRECRDAIPVESPSRHSRQKLQNRLATEEVLRSRPGWRMPLPSPSLRASRKRAVGLTTSLSAEKTRSTGRRGSYLRPPPPSWSDPPAPDWLRLTDGGAPMDAVYIQERDKAAAVGSIGLSNEHTTISSPPSASLCFPPLLQSS